MKISIGSKGYCFQLEEKDLIYNLPANNVIHAKESYLKHMENIVNESIDDAIFRLRELDK